MYIYIYIYIYIVRADDVLHELPHGEHALGLALEDLADRDGRLPRSYIYIYMYTCVYVCISISLSLSIYIYVI